MSTPIFQGFDALFDHVAKQDPGSTPRMVEEGARRLKEATAEQLAEELRRPSTNLVVMRDQAMREACARILINTNL